MHPFSYVAPKSVTEVTESLAALGPGARLLAGGTDLLIQMEAGRLQPATVVFLGEVEELRGIAPTDRGGLLVGAMATLREIEQHPLVQGMFPALAAGAREVGSVQIRNLATLAGNLCNASPSADTAPALLAYDARVEIAGPAGARSVGVAEFWTGPGRTALADSELVTAIRLPAPPAGQRHYYRKLAVRKAMDLAIVGVAVTLVPGTERPEWVRIALGAVGPVAFRAVAAERELERAGPAALSTAAQVAADAASPIDDQRASARFRREMVRSLVAKGLRAILQP